MSCKNLSITPEFSQEEIAGVVSRGELLTMEIEFNRNCNFKCVHCYLTQHTNGHKELAKEEFYGVITQAKELGVRNIVILGGEPMLYPHLLDMIKFIRSQGLTAEIFTNGANMTEANTRTLYDHEVAVVLKMNTFDKRIQDTISGCCGAYEQIQTAFENLKRAGYLGDKRLLGVSSVICQHNIKELAALWQWLRDQNITPYFEVITPQGKAKCNRKLHVESRQLRELFYELADIDRTKYGYKWEPQPPLVGMKCLRHQYSCVVTAYGDVQPCVGVDIAVGNVREAGLAEIIKNSDVIRELRNFRQNIKGPCRKCDKLGDCYGCRGAAYQLTGDYLASDPMCWRNAKRLDDIEHLPVKADRLVPHKPPMLIIQKLVEVREKLSIAEMKVSRNSIFVGSDGKLDEVSYLEIIAQTIAAHNGFKNLDNGGEMKGFIAGVKNLKIMGTAKVGDILRVNVYKIIDYGELGIIRGEVVKGEEILASGEIKIWHRREQIPTILPCAGVNSDLSACPHAESAKGSNS